MSVVFVVFAAISCSSSNDKSVPTAPICEL